MPQITLKIPSIHCASCIGRVTETLKKTPGVLDASVSFATRSAVVETAVSAPPADILSALEKIGYPGEIVQGISPGDLSKDMSAEGRRWLVSAGGSGAIAVVLMFAHPPAAAAFLLATVAMGLSGWKFLHSAGKAIASKILTMDVLIAFGTSVAYAAGIVAWAAGVPAHFYFESAAMILALISLGRYLETRTRAGAGGALRALAQRMPVTARRITAGGEETVSAQAVAAGDIVRVHSGEKVPVDGNAEDAGALVNDSFWTGQAEWHEMQPGGFVAAGSVVEQGSLTLKATRPAGESALAKMGELVAQAQQSKASVEALVDKVSGIFVPVVLALSLGTFAAWMFFSGSWSGAAQAAVAVAIIACPCALGLATPTALMAGMGAGALSGIMIRNAAALERLDKITAVFLDKTGTVTDGKLALARVVPKGVGEEELLGWALTAERQAVHPLAQAVRDEATRRNIRPFGEGQIRVERGYGVEVSSGGRRAAVGRRDWISARAPLFPADAASWNALDKEGFSVVGAALDGEFIGCLAFRDTVRPEAAAAIEDLKKLGYDVAVVSGDQEYSVRKTAEQLRIRDCYFGRDPGQKAELIRSYQAKGHKVAFVGDGINDAAALAAADLGIAMGAGADVAKEAGDILLVRPGLDGLPRALRLGRRIFRVIRQNLFWAFAYNVAAIPLAASGKITPAVAAGAMALSSVTVVLNSLFLRKNENRPHFYRGRA